MKAASIVPHDNDDNDDDDDDVADFKIIPLKHLSKVRNPDSNTSRSARRKSSGATTEGRRRSSGLSERRRSSAFAQNAAKIAEISMLSTRLKVELKEVIEEQHNLFKAHTQLSAQLSSANFDFSHLIQAPDAIRQALRQCAARLCIHANTLQQSDIAQELEALIIHLSSESESEDIPSNQHANTVSFAIPEANQIQQTQEEASHHKNDKERDECITTTH
eukprot:CAMPEP_0197321298 /NCGR_PEP_ID=MMETSP0891-20130614/64289_1 /TAXON_ID=44058 ORGANISM="Aureoumbra lagunensis, Strain CCMP1510" /NCGR_SAMPLE_ID=MMETSP0891 /ASSEMBLY_ACC=CAM_ASM_000534 /LENGTH=218 /DNA_ID=CAMNT_0042813099 /DNA_START=216 /DNA_END=872 /DNA_ORIENTATION=+